MSLSSPIETFLYKRYFAVAPPSRSFEIPSDRIAQSCWPAYANQKGIVAASGGLCISPAKQAQRRSSNVISQAQLSIGEASETGTELGQGTVPFDLIVHSLVYLPGAEKACRQTRRPLRHEGTEKSRLLVYLSVRIVVVLDGEFLTTRRGQVDVNVKLCDVRSSRQVLAELFEVVLNSLDERFK